MTSCYFIKNSQHTFVLLFLFDIFIKYCVLSLRATNFQNIFIHYFIISTLYVIIVF